ncbi:MAG: site-2 protease family protein [Lysobacteraceae bacterium]
MTRGLWPLGRWRGVPVWLHWSVCLALAWFGYRHRQWLPALLSFAGFLGLLAVHELGHAVAAQSRRVRVHEIRLYLLHGLCRHAAPARERDAIVIAWGGVLAQAAVLLVALPLSAGIGALSPMLSIQLAPLFAVLVWTNLWMIAFNLLPIAPLDGHRAWRVLRPLPGALALPGRRVVDGAMRGWRIARRRRAMKRDAEHKVVDLMERIRNKR